MRRSSPEQIIAWNLRRGERGRSASGLISQVEELRREAGGLERVAPRYLEFVPIRLVTILEVFLREVISELVDGDDRAFQRAESLVKNTKIEFSFAAHFNRKSLTIGDFVAHNVSLNDIDAVFKILNTLIDGYSGKLKLVHERWSEDAASWPLPAILQDYSKTMACLSSIFTVRHVLTHELPAAAALDFKRLPDFFDATQAFIEATDWCVIETIHGSIPRTQLAMNMSAAENLRGEEELMAKAVESVSALPRINVSEVLAMQESWEEFARSHADLVARQVEGGSMHPLIWASEMAALTRDRTVQLSNIAKEWMEQHYPEDAS